MNASQSALERPHILIVTDDPDLSAFLAEGLVYGGFWTSTVASGIQTLEVFRLRTFDLALVDAALRDLSAVEVIRRLRGRSDRGALASPRTDIPILLIAATAEELQTADVTTAGADGVLVAPLDLEQLVPHLHAVVAAWRASHPDRPWADATH
ncbi:MAG: two-component system, OmpR family, response regulator [Thermomicrobiales bacterium]|nr:two-component system, OmpR family, response regulator [Thermomicrobiales bacterium]